MRTAGRISGLFLFYAFSAIPKAAAASPDPPVLCPFDLMTGKTVSGGYGYIVLMGWALDPKTGAPVVKMQTLLDGQPAGDVLLSGYRPDVAKQFGPHAEWAGWIASVSLRGIAPGTHTVEVIAFDRAGVSGSCGSRNFTVRSFTTDPDESVQIAGELLLRSLLFSGWLALIGWGILRSIGRARDLGVAPALGLAAMAIAIEAGGVVQARPILSLSVLTGIVVIGLAWSLTRRPPRLRCSRGAVATIAIMSLFAVMVSIPFARHGRGAVLGASTDAAWESTVAESIVRYGWRIPHDAYGYLAAMTSEWRRLNVRAGTPYPLAALAQAFGFHAHEAHSVLVLSLGALAIAGTAAVARRLLPCSRAVPAMAAGLIAASSIPLAGVYNQHAGILLALVLYLGFVHELVRVRLGRPISAAIPAGILIAGDWTLYPETMTIWIPTACFFLLGQRSWGGRKAIFRRLAVALLLAVVLNPVALARSLRYAGAIPHAEALATPKARRVFGDTHHFPLLDVIAGIREYSIDRTAPANMLQDVIAGVREYSIDRTAPLLRASRRGAALLILATALLGWRRLHRRERLALIALTLPVCAALFVNRWIEFPYGFSKALPHAAAVWAIGFAVLAVRVGPGRWRNALAVGTTLIVFALSLGSAIHAIERASRAVPAHDPAYNFLPALTHGLERDTVILFSEPLPWQHDWLAYSLGEYRIEPLGTKVSAAPGKILRLIDLRDEPAPAGISTMRANRCFVLVREESTGVK